MNSFIQNIIIEINGTPKPEKTKFFAFSIITFVMAAADLTITYIGSPDLAFEANPLVTVFGLGWSALIIANIIVYAFTVTLLYIAFIKYKRKVVQCEDFMQYMSMLYFDRPDKQKWLWYKFPKGKEKMIMSFAPVGYAVAYVFPIVRFIAIFGWVMFLAAPEFCFLCFFNLPHVFFDHMEIVIFAALGIMFLFILVYYWFKKEYKINKIALEGISTGEYIESDTMQEVKEIPKQEIKEKRITELEEKNKAKIEAKRVAQVDNMLKEIQALKDIGWTSTQFSGGYDIDRK